MTLKIAPSILSADFAHLGQEISSISEAGADMIHIDVMDGAFVQNITIGPCVIKAIKNYTNLPFDVHLMVNDPEHLFESFADAGSDIITFHLEASKDPRNAIDIIKKLGKKAGISIMPSTPASAISEFIEHVDLVLVMTVQPGFGGQKFMEDQLPKIQEVSEMMKDSKKDIILSIDGGINEETAKRAVLSGATMLVAGSYIFGHEKYADAISRLKSSA